MYTYASERAKGWGAVWAKSGHAAQHYYDMLLARLGMGEGEKSKRNCRKQSPDSVVNVLGARPPPWGLPFAAASGSIIIDDAHFSEDLSGRLREGGRAPKGGRHSTICCDPR